MVNKSSVSGTGDASADERCIFGFQANSKARVNVRQTSLLLDMALSESESEDESQTPV